MSNINIPPLTINIPYDDAEEKRLISILKWLETPDAKKMSTEEVRLKRLKEVTEEFKITLRKKEIFRKAALADELYS